nr:bile acid:sodium symporter [Shewanella polaris]
MVLPMMINLPIRKVFEGGDLKVQLATQFINFAITPFLAFAIGLYFFPDNHYLVLGILLTGLLPTSGMTISWTGMAKGNIPAAIKMTIFGLLLGSLLTPIYINLLIGENVDIDMMKMVQQVVIIVLIPLIIGHLIQRALIHFYGMSHYQEKLKSKFPPFSTLGVLGIVFVAMALKSKTIIGSPILLGQILLPLVLLYLANFLLSTIIGKLLFKRGDAIALLYGTVMRNLSIALAIAMTAFGEEGSDIALVISLGYIIQVQMGAWIVKLTDRIYGKPAPSVAEDFVHMGIFSLHQDDTLRQAIQLLSEEKIHSLAVLDNQQKIQGLVSMEQIIDSVADGADLDNPLSVLPLTNALLVDLQQPIASIVNDMKRTHTYKIVVTNKKGEVEGIISGLDILEYLSRK